MDNWQTYQIIFVLVGIAILSYLFYFLYKKATDKKEGMNSYMSDELRYSLIAIQVVLTGLSGGAFGVWQALWSLMLITLKPIGEFAESIPVRVENIFESLIHYLYSFGQAFDVLGLELVAGVEGIGDAFVQSIRLGSTELNEEIVVNMGTGLQQLDEVLFTDDRKGIIRFILDIGILLSDIQYIFKYVKSFIFDYLLQYILCLFNKILNFPKCAIFYILDILFGLFIYLPVTTVIFFLNYGLCIDGSTPLNGALEQLECLDEFMRPFLGGYSLIHYSESILDTCYECRNVHPLPESPVYIFERDALELHDNLMKIPVYLKDALERIKYGADRIPNALADAFSLLGYQLKASFELLGQAFPDSANTLGNQIVIASEDIGRQFSNWDDIDLRWQSDDPFAVKEVPFHYQAIGGPYS